MGLCKKYAYSKHDYYIHCQQMDSTAIIIDWKISNWYDPDIYQGVDTLYLKE